MAYYPADEKSRKAQQDFMGGFANFMRYGQTTVPEKYRNKNAAQAPARGRGMANLGEHYKGEENAATIHAASYNENAAGANKYVRDLLNIKDPARTTPDPTPDPPTRNTRPPRDPLNTGATGTITGLSGGSLSEPWTDSEFSEMLAAKHGIQVRNPFDTAPIPLSFAADQQITLDPGMISYTENGGYKPSGEMKADMFSKYTNPEFKAPVDMETFGTQRLYSAMEKDQAPIGSGKDLDLGDDEQYVSPGLSDRSRAFLDYDGPGGSAMALRAAEASQGIMYDRGQHKALNAEGEFQDVTKEGARMRASGKIGAQDLLSSYLSEVPQKAVAKVLETGDPEAIDPTKEGLTEYANFSALNTPVFSGGEMSDINLFNTTKPEGGGPVTADDEFFLYKKKK